MTKFNMMTANVTGKMKVNALTADTLQNAIGTDLPVKAVAIAEKTDEETGEIKTVGYIWTESGECFSTISETAMDSIEAIYELLEENPDEKITAMPEMRKSKGGRDFIVLPIR